MRIIKFHKEKLKRHRLFPLIFRPSIINRRQEKKCEPKCVRKLLKTHLKVSYLCRIKRFKLLKRSLNLFTFVKKIFSQHFYRIRNDLAIRKAESKRLSTNPETSCTIFLFSLAYFQIHIHIYNIRGPSIDAPQSRALRTRVTHAFRSLRVPVYIKAINARLTTACFQRSRDYAISGDGVSAIQ